MVGSVWQSRQAHIIAGHAVENRDTDGLLAFLPFIQGDRRATAGVWWSEENLWESALSFYHVDARGLKSGHQALSVEPSC